MNDIKWIKVTFWISAALTLLVAAWWGLVFHFVGQQTGEPVTAFAACMVAPTAECNLLRGMAWLQGINPYEPIAFWWALSMTVFAWAANKSISARAA